jgi:peptidoglycan/xylan/chitin deacetylase (PgdA/CDA1 family)
MTGRPLASVSLDVDNLWSYLKTHGDAGWESRPSYLDVFIPYALDALDAVGIKITFFIVGVDADRDDNAKALSAITERGHEVGNHSFEHEPWLHLYGLDELERDIVRAEEAIESALGQRPIGLISWRSAAICTTPPLCRPTWGPWRARTISGPHNCQPRSAESAKRCSAHSGMACDR